MNKFTSVHEYFHRYFLKCLSDHAIELKQICLNCRINNPLLYHIPDIHITRWMQYFTQLPQDYVTIHTKVV